MKIKNIVTLLVTAVFIFGFSFWCMFITTPDYSESERRVLASMPEVKAEDIFSGKFAKDFETYSTDRFPLRDMWRTIKAYTRLKIFCQKDNNEIFTSDNHISKLNYPKSTPMMDNALKKFEFIKNEYIKDNKVYLTIIPDKNMYLAEDNGYLSLDYKEFFDYFSKSMTYAEYIDISGLLEADDYYYTDTHWRQECITDVAKHLADSMGVEINQSFTEHTLDIPFNGVYVGQSALKCTPDTIRYLTNDTIDNLKLDGAEAVYDMAKAQSRDPYEMFLSGNQPVVKIENPSQKDGKRLIVFRDSYFSSLAPLLASGYSEITLVDLRYISSNLVGQYVNFENADVLFAYSSLLLNDSLALK